jgi:Abortive infection C-terminus
MTVNLTDLLVAAISKMVDDAQAGEYREPSHSDLEFYINRHGLQAADPKFQGQTVGKAKRVRAVLSFAMDNDNEAGGKLTEALVAKVRACGGFRATSTNYVGEEAITSVIEAFATEGYSLSLDGELRAKALDALNGRELTDALEAYARRAKRGSEDAALLTGTSKDLLEATAAHVLETRYGSYSTQSNFPALLGQAFVALGMATPQDPVASGEAAHRSLERAMFESACAVNRLRNKQGTGHGRPWLPGVTATQACAAAETAGCVSGYLLDKLQGR